ncbi:MAG: acyltransferase [Candidatus Abyssobacteria bacterium SURF_5]|uniref:Acyltransferase n=1 Tax=Abyssobacteria bacterium (strain SURF_5) TaxID=2093360 RepID=A0A3A4NC46_ABYX5|nr:MAG: acyltransferase [Candidatus Abyssubacteria bacterium SURF_5]
MQWRQRMSGVQVRRYDIDWLRVLAVLLLIPFHTAIIFAPADSLSYIKDQENRVLNQFSWFVHQWHMPLLFLVSGAATWFSLNSRTGRQYLGERVQRLVIPLVFGTLAIVPPAVYFQRLQFQQFQGSYIAFYPHFFNGIYPEGNFMWGSLWFLAYLFVFSLIVLPLLLFFRREFGKRLISTVASLCERRGEIFLFAVPLAVIQAALRARWPGFQNLIGDWANFFFYITFFIYGYLLCSERRFEEAIARNGTLALGMGVVSWLFIGGISWIGKEPVPGYSPEWILYMILFGFNSWFWIIAILSFGQRHLGFTNKVLQYGTEAALPFYIIHHTIIVVIGYYVVQWNLRGMSKFFVITTASLIVTILLYDIFVKRANVTRFLFGMRVG